MQTGYIPVLSTLVLNAIGEIGALAGEVIENVRQLFLIKIVSKKNFLYVI